MFRIVQFVWLCIFILFCSFYSNAQQVPVGFKRHSFIENTLAGHRWGIEFPVDVAYCMSSDYDYESTDAKNPILFGAGFKFTLKTDFDRGIGIGMGLDYSTSNYLRMNLLLDLDFLFHFQARTNNKYFFGESIMSRYKISSVIAEKNGKTIREYYIALQFFQIHFANFTFTYGINKGIFRKSYPPYFADQGMFYSLSYTFRKQP